MPSRTRQLHYLGLRLAAWLLWLPLTGSIRHGRTWGELKRLRPTQAVALLAPLACYAAVAAWLYAYFPDELVVWASSVSAMGLFLGGSLVAATVLAAKLLDWSLVRTDR